MMVYRIHSPYKCLGIVFILTSGCYLFIVSGSRQSNAILVPGTTGKGSAEVHTEHEKAVVHGTTEEESAIVHRSTGTKSAVVHTANERGSELVHGSTDNESAGHKPYKASHGTTRCKRDLKGAKFYSQSREDEALLLNYFNFPQICQGVYVEIGAYNGLLISNTKFFEDTLDWGGVLIEANPKDSMELLRNRNSNKNHIYREAACPEGQGHINYTGGHGVGGMPELIRAGIKKTFYNDQLPQSQKIACRPIGRMLRESGVTAVDFFSLDVEGAELYVLHTMDWTIPVNVWVVEMDRSKDDQIIQLMASKGYRIAKWNIRGFCLQGKSCTSNVVFEHQDYTY